MFSIGEFSKITGLTVKTLRFYHEQRLLIPTHVETGSGYRFYSGAKVETARIITALRELGFSLAEISEIVGSHTDDASILSFLQARRDEIRTRMQTDRQVVRTLDRIISIEQEAKIAMSSAKYSVEEKEVEPLLIAGIRMKGKYSDCGTGFGRIGKNFGRYMAGKGMLLHFDSEYHADDADFEVAVPVRSGARIGTKKDGIEVRELPGGTCLSLLHLGPYEQIGRSYEKILNYAKDRGIEFSCPSREIYLKGPGMIFRGNPKKYFTEIQMFFAE